ncbi:TonB-dependent receptor plug domain-containing protein [Nitrincola iocasae]|uniref:TonB-dependent receptor n=1 Tax=Nitrincola iocasae TaxID=2614693 RepID=A0A5J6LAK4_9GAMM|nr:TonB-dependent receptor [Nitrincola iocasae]QEW05416.1 TonB-dependent receptor [Nitrincola iocasae]
MSEDSLMPHHKVNKLALLLTGLTSFLYAAVVFADISHLDESAFLIDIPMVTSATRLSQHQSDAPVSMTVIDRATITASGAQTVPDLLRLVPGFQVAHVNSNKYAATYHGYSDDFPNRLEVMIDGRSVYMPLISSPDWTSLALHLDDIERIEVIRGSNTATQGSNAFLGAINIITRHPAAEAKASASVTLGSLDTANSNLRFSGNTSMGHYRLSAAHEENTGSKLFSDGARRSYLNFSGSFAPTLRDQIDLRAGIDRGHITIGSLKAPETFNSVVTQEREYHSSFQHISWEHIINPNTTFELTGYRNQLTLSEAPPTLDDIFRSELDYDDYNDWLENPAAFALEEALFQQLLDSNPSLRVLSENGSTRQEDLQFSIVHQQSQTSTSTGLGYRRDTGKGDTLFDQGDVHSTRFRLFANSVISPSQAYTINLGAMHEKEESGPAATSGRAALSLHITPDVTLRFGLSSSERLPSLHERYSQSTIYFTPDKNQIFDAIRRPNPDLEPEHILSREAGLLYKFSSMPGYLDLRIFNEHITKGIATYREAFTDELNPSDQTIRVSKNIADWQNQGAEFQLRLQPTNSFWFLLNYAYINNTAKTFALSADKPFTRTQLAPRHSASLLLNWQPRPDINLSASHYFVDQMHWLEGDDRDTYNRTDLRAAKHWTLGPQTQAELSLTVQNALGPSYQEFYDYHNFDRRFFIQFRLKYH